MSQRLVTSTINTNIPGAYTSVSVKSTASGLATSGVIVLMGEADGGSDYSSVQLSNNTFGPTDLAKVTQIYTSGPIVDAMRALSAPSNDTDIVGSASTVYIVKTNKGTSASSIIDTNYGTLSDQNYGVGGNRYKYTVTSLSAEQAPKITGGTIASFGAGLNGAAFAIRLSGGTSSTVTLSSTSSNHSNITTLVTELNSLLPGGIVASALSSFLVLTMSQDTSAYHKGSGKSFELIDTIAGDLAFLGLTASLVISSQEPAVEVQITRSDTGVNKTLDIKPAVSLMVGYNGTSATMSVNSTTLTTTVAGGAGTSLSIQLSQFTTIASLASFINSQAGYSCSCASSANQLPTSALDMVSAVGIASSGINKPGRIKNSLYAFQKAMSTSVLNFTATATAGLPNPSPAAYLQGGTKGGTMALDIVNAFAQLGGIQCNIIVPLFSQDATTDIVAGNTDSSSTYSIAAINELAKSHCIEFSTPTLKRNRQAILSINDTFDNCKTAAQTSATYRCAMTCQSVTQVNSFGVNTQFLPWYAAVLAAGMQAGGFYKAIVNHYTNAVSYSDPTGYDSGSPSNVESALDAGLLVLSRDTGGIKWVSDQTTYGLDTNFVYNSIQAVYCSDILALDLAQKFQTAFVGKSVADVSAASALSYLQACFDFYKKIKLTASSSDAPLGYRNAKIVINAPEMDVSVEAKLSSSIYFIPIDLSLSAVQQSAG